MIWRHPSKRALREWLAGDIDEDVDNHVSTCERCASDLEDLASTDTGTSLREALLAVLDPPEYLAHRLGRCSATSQTCSGQDGRRRDSCSPTTTMTTKDDP